MKSSIKMKQATIKSAWIQFVKPALDLFYQLLRAKVYFGRSPAGLPPGSVVFFPIQPNILGCGIAAIVSYKNSRPTESPPSAAQLAELIKPIEGQGCKTCHQKDLTGLDESYLGGKDLIESLWQRIQAIKGEKHFFAIYTDSKER